MLQVFLSSVWAIQSLLPPFRWKRKSGRSAAVRNGIFLGIPTPRGFNPSLDQWP